MIILECWYQHSRKHPYILLYTSVWTKKILSGLFPFTKVNGKRKESPSEQSLWIFCLETSELVVFSLLGAYQPLVPLRRLVTIRGIPCETGDFGVRTVKSWGDAPSSRMSFFDRISVCKCLASPIFSHIGGRKMLGKTRHLKNQLVWGSKCWDTRSTAILK